MNIFTLINSLFFSKKHIDLNSDDESQFNAYMINRWISMYSIDMVNIINNTSNRYAHVFDTKQDQYNWFYNLFPRVRFKKISYIKKNKKESNTKDKTEDLTSLIAKNHEISEREVRMYHDLFGS
jgi:DNA-binding transcriptional regulator GbsR (MarR family)